jgi:hypothetical protein
VSDLDQQIRAKLDAERIDQDDPRTTETVLYWDELAGALRAVLDLHQRSILGGRAGVRPDVFGDGCVICPHTPLIREYTRAGIRWHDHVDENPTCITCHGDDDDSFADWPCPTLTAIASALGVTTPERTTS